LPFQRCESFRPLFAGRTRESLLGVRLANPRSSWTDLKSASGPSGNSARWDGDGVRLDIIPALVTRVFTVKSKGNSTATFVLKEACDRSEASNHHGIETVRFRDAAVDHKLLAAIQPTLDRWTASLSCPVQAVLSFPMKPSSPCRRTACDDSDGTTRPASCAFSTTDGGSQRIILQ
jgi:hypothetical protein